MMQDDWAKTSRLGGLRRFAVAITILNLLGHTFFGFEQSFAQPLAAVASAYGTELFLELVDARIRRRRPNFLGGIVIFVDFFLSAHITGLAVAMLLYANDRIWPIVFATVVAITSKSVLRVRVGNSTRHFFNPSNLGITATLLLFPWVGIAPPYHFTENLDRIGDWILPAIIVLSGTILNARLTHKLPLIVAWLLGFIAQAAIRTTLSGESLPASLLPMTGVAFILFTFYMVTDPATTPTDRRGQILFGAGVAAAYGMLLQLHIVFGLFFALTIICAVRGLNLFARSVLTQRVLVEASAEAPSIVREI